jgi:membrane-associated phospholipid phosphatase
VVASRRRRRVAPAVWATGLTLAAASAYLRIASDQHYLTDVLAGVGSGVAIGLAVPWFHRARSRDSAVVVSLAPAGAGALLLLTHR